MSLVGVAECFRAIVVKEPLSGVFTWYKISLEELMMYVLRGRFWANVSFILSLCEGVVVGCEDDEGREGGPSIAKQVCLPNDAWN